MRKSYLFLSYNDTPSNLGANKAWDFVSMEQGINITI